MIRYIVTSFLVSLPVSLSVWGEEIALISDGIKLNTSPYNGEGPENKLTLTWLQGNSGIKKRGTSEWARELNMKPKLRRSKIDILLTPKKR